MVGAHDGPEPLLMQEAHAPSTGDVQFLPKPQSNGRWRLDAQARAQRMSIGRFWGMGPHSNYHRQSSYSRAHTSVQLRLGHALQMGDKAGTARHRKHDIALKLGVSYDALYGSAIPSLPSPRSVHPKVPNISGNTWLATVALETRHDTVLHGPHAKGGIFADAALGAVLGLTQTGPFVYGHIDVRKHWAHARRVGTVARAYVRYVSSPKAPFFMQSALGGQGLRGHNDGRFVDQGAWSFEVEERLHLWSSRAWGHSVAWHVDPYVGVGQVFAAPTQMFLAVQPVVGVGIRAVVHPHLVTRWDIASDLNRVRGIFALGYPF